DISISAEKRAEILLKNAELDAELTVREARERAERLKNENQVMERRYVEFRSKYKRMLESELERFEETQEEVFADFNDNKLEELVSAPMAEGRESLSTDSLEKTMFAKVYTDPEEDRKTVVINMKEEAGE
ncbi:MAG: hypothetical protein RR626_03265, partial [Anaerovoracaceae bacterium]